MANGCELGPYKRGANPIWSFVDLDGLQCDDTYYMWVLQNEVPYQIETVYHNSQNTPWNQPIQFLANGTLPSDIFFDPTKVYTLEIRQKDPANPFPTQTDPLIYRIPNYVPSAVQGTGPGDVSSSPTDNQVLNPQFSIVNFSSPFSSSSLSNTSVEIAPGWFLDLSGNGSVALERVALAAGIANPTNAPYALRINLSGWSEAVLRQRFEQAGNLWADKFVSSSITGRIEGGLQSLSMRLDASNGAQLALLQTPMLGNQFMEFTAVSQIPAAANPDLPPNAFVDLKIFLPNNGDLYLTSIQLIASSNNTQFSYEQDTIERQESNLFSYYNEKLQAKPITSHLVGWDFGLNPAQLPPTTPGVWGPYASGSNTSNYIWDQTIGYQSSDQGFSASRAGDGALSVQIETNNVRFALVQYVEAEVAKQILSRSFAINVACRKQSGQARRGIVSVFYTTDIALPDIKSPTFESLIDTLNADGSVSAFNTGNWTEVPRSNRGPAYIEINPGSLSDTMLSGWQINPATNLSNVTHLAIVVGFEEMDSTEIVDIHSISLCSGDIATRPAPKTLDETLRECQRYYAQSYQSGDDIGTATDVGALVYPMLSDMPHDAGGGNIASAGMLASFTIELPSLQFSANQIVDLYSIDGAINMANLRVVGQTNTNVNVAQTNWVLVKSQNRLSFSSAVSTKFLNKLTLDTFTPVVADLRLHYICDARLGVV